MIYAHHVRRGWAMVYGIVIFLILLAIGVLRALKNIPYWFGS